MDTISVTWANAALAAVRHIGSSGSPADRPRIGPPMVARSLAILHTAIYDAWAIYDAAALPTRLRLIRNAGGTDTQRVKAISQAAYHVLVDQFPSEVAIFDAALAALGFTNSRVAPDAKLLIS